MPKRIQLQRTKGWRLPPGVLVVARPTLWGNPFTVERWGRERAVKLYRAAGEGLLSEGLNLFWADDLFHALRLRDQWLQRFRQQTGCLPIDYARYFRGQSVACWCRLDEECHGDVVLEWARKPLEIRKPV